MVVAKQDVEAECAAYSEHMNNLLKTDEFVSHLVPLESSTLLPNVADGLLLSRLIHAIRPGLVPVGKLQREIDRAQLLNPSPGSKDIFRATENQNIFLEAVVKLGCKVVNVGAQDLIDGKEDLVLGVVWQIIRAHLLADINLMSHPELIRLMRPGETLQHLLELGSEALLLRWVNYHLTKAGVDKEATSFSESFKSGELYLHLMRQIAPELAEESLVHGGLESPNPEIRAMAVLEVADKLGCRQFVTAKDILAGRQRLNLAFTATLFNHHIGILLPSEAELREVYAKLRRLTEQVATLEQELQDAKDHLKAQQQELARHRQQAELTAEEYETKLAREGDRAAALTVHVEQLEAQAASQKRQLEDLQLEAATQKEAFERVCGNQSSINEEIMRQLQQTREQLALTQKQKDEEAARAAQLAQKLSEQATAAENLLLRTKSVSHKAALAFKERQTNQLDQILRLALPEMNQQEHAAQLELVRKQRKQEEEPSTPTLSDQERKEKEREQELTISLEMLKWMVSQLVAQKKALAKKAQDQDGQLSRMRQMNDLMAEKVKEIAEELNQKKTSKK